MEESSSYPARKESVQVGVDILSERWISSSSQRKLLRADIAGKAHVPCERVRKTSSGLQRGSLVIGESSIIFLDDAPVPDIVSSHPISFIDSYRRVGSELYYSLKKEHFGKSGGIMEFSYRLNTEIEVDKIIAALDHAVLIHSKMEDKHAGDLTLLDEEVHTGYTRFESTVSIEAQRIEGERFKCEAVFMNGKPHFLHMLVHRKPEQESVVCIVNSRGIALLHSSDNLEVFSWREITGFGPKTHKFSNDSFAFSVPSLHGSETKGPHAVVLMTPHALNIHQLALSYCERAAAGEGDKTTFPAVYKPVEASK